MDAHTLPCDCCGNRFEDDDLGYFEEHNEYLCQVCAANLEVEDTEPEQL